jgi:hypothetical protein
MDTTVSIRVFEWRGALHVIVDRIWPAPDRRYAPHARVVSFTTDSLPGLREDEATEWALTQMTLWMNAGWPTDGRVAVPAPPRGGHRGERANGAPTCTDGVAALPSQTQPAAVVDSDAGGVSDGLQPAGVQQCLPFQVNLAERPEQT